MTHTATPDLQTLLNDVAQFYAKGLTNKKAINFLTSRRIIDGEVLKRLCIGYSDGNLPGAVSQEQAALLRDFELFCGTDKPRDELVGAVTVPFRDEQGRITGFIGVRTDEPFVELTVPDQLLGGFIGADALPVFRDEILLPTGLRKYFILLGLGFQNVFPIFNAQSRQSIVTILKDSRIKRVVVFKNDEALGRELTASGIEVAVSPLGISDGLTKEELEAAIKAAVVFTPTKSQDTYSLVKHKDFWMARRGSLSYRMSGMKQGFTTFVRVSLKAEKDGKRHVDSLDLLSARARNNFSKELAGVIGEEPAVIGQDLMFLLERLEEEEERRDGANAAAPQPLTPGQEMSGMAFLRNPDLLDELVRDLDTLGYAGEEANKQVAYLVATSRLQDDPLNMLLVSGSGAGKSALIDAVRKLMPPTDVVSLTSLSDQALNYLEPDGLLHKLLVLGEAVHGETVNHQLREIVSAKELSRMVVTRDDRTGKLVSKIVTTPAVVSLMMGTTHRNHNPENLTRYFILHADESEAQTARIHQVQNSRFSLDALKAMAKRVPAVIEKHHAAQRLLRPVKVVAPEGLTWDLPVHKLRARRDNQSLNNLMATICFLRQFQKERKSSGGITYIECDEYDQRKAWELFQKAIMPSTYQEYPEAMVRLYETIRSFCAAQAVESNLSALEIVFDQRSIRKAVNWMSGESVKLYFRKLVELEFLVLKSSGSRGQRKTYSLAEDAGWQELEGGSNGT